MVAGAASIHAASHWLRPATYVSGVIGSEDEGKVASHMVIVNGHSESLNRDALTSMMRDEGFQLEREIGPSDKPFSIPGDVQGGCTLFFKGVGKEAVAVIARDVQGPAIYPGRWKPSRRVPREKPSR